MLAGFDGIQSNLLSRLNLLDISILVLVATMYVGLYISLQETSKSGPLLLWRSPSWQYCSSF